LKSKGSNSWIFKTKEFLKDNKVDFSDDFVIHLRFSKLE